MVAQPIARRDQGTGVFTANMAKVAPSFLGATFAMELIDRAGLVLSEGRPPRYIPDGFWNLRPTRCLLGGGPAAPPPGPPVPALALAVGVAATGGFAVC